MTPRSEEERTRITGAARKQLAEGTWGEVMAVFGYPNPRAPRTSPEEFKRFKAFYESLGYPNLAKFAETVAFEEQQNNVTMSYNLSMRTRSGNPAEFLMTPDIMVGTRWGIEGAAVWLKNLSEVIPEAIPETVQIFEKVFGEALKFLAQPGRKVTLDQMVEHVVAGTELPPPDSAQ
jgi:hypothetical protein